MRWVCALALLLAAAPGSAGETRFLVSATLTARDCGEGLNTFRASASGLLLAVAAEDADREWAVTSEIWDCAADLVIPGLVASNTVFGNTNTTDNLGITTQRDLECRGPRKQARATAAMAGGSGTSRSRTTLCRECRGGGGDDDWEI